MNNRPGRYISKEDKEYRRKEIIRLKEKFNIPNSKIAQRFGLTTHAVFTIISNERKRSKNG